MTYQASKVVIITEKLILDQVTRLIAYKGASGYTIVAAGGKGSRGVRSSSRASVVDEFANVKIEVIVSQRETAEKIAEAVAEQFFNHYSGITYLEAVEILRPHKF